MTQRTRRVVPPAALALVILTAASCARVSPLERFGGTLVAVHADRVMAGADMDTVRHALSQALERQYYSADITDLESGGGFLVQFQYGDGATALRTIVDEQERRAKAIELRLAHTTRRSEGAVAYAIGGGLVDVFVEPATLVDGSALVAATTDANDFRLRFDPDAQAALAAAKARTPSALLGVFLNGEFAGALPLADTVTATDVVFAANGAPWQTELTALTTAAIPATLRLGEERQVVPPEFDGRGSKYPW